jgi:hypothetical protein
MNGTFYDNGWYMSMNCFKSVIAKIFLKSSCLAYACLFDL